MNIIDIGIVVVIGASIIIGLYSGFLSSVLNIASYFISWTLAAIFYRPLASWFAGNTEIVNSLIHYTEGASRITSFEVANTAVSTLNSGQIGDIVSSSSFPAPFSKLIESNMIAQTLADKGLSTVADYFNYTLVYTALNILAFVAILLAVFVVFCVINAVVSTVLSLPVLKQFDGLLGGIFGLARGVLIVFALFMVVPIVLAALPVATIESMIESSALAQFFLDRNFLLHSIRGFI